MKTPYLAILILAAVVGTGVQAQQTSAIGFTAEAISDTMCLRAENSPRKLTLWLVNATNPEFGSEGSRVVRHVGGFELKFGGAQSILVTSVDFPIPATNTGTNKNLLVEYAVPQTVFADQTLILAEVWILAVVNNTLGNACTEFSEQLELLPADGGTVPESMSFIDADDPEWPFVAAEANGAYAVYEYIQVANEPETWGAVKALYR